MKELFDSALELMLKLGICALCKHAKYISVNGEVTCELREGATSAMLLCKDFVAREEGQK